jgi:hypothetical protein
LTIKIVLIILKSVDDDHQPDTGSPDANPEFPDDKRVVQLRIATPVHGPSGPRAANDDHQGASETIAELDQLVCLIEDARLRVVVFDTSGPDPLTLHDRAPFST